MEAKDHNMVFLYPILSAKYPAAPSPIIPPAKAAFVKPLYYDISVLQCSLIDLTERNELTCHCAEIW